MELHLQWYKTVLLKRYATFKGRAGKREFWTFALMNTAVSVIINFLVKLEPSIIYLGWAFSFVILVPSLAVTVRRLHDIGKTGWWYLLVFIPLGVFYLLYLTLKSSGMEPNKYGEVAPQEPEIT